MFKPSLILLSIGAILLIPLSRASAQEISPINNSHVVRVVYFYPADYSPDLKYIWGIDPLMADVQKWYADQLGGATFRLLSTQVVKGKLQSSQYGDPAWPSIFSEIGVDCAGDVVTIVFLARPIQQSGGRTCSGFWYVGGDFNGDVTIEEGILDAEIVASQTGYCLNGAKLGEWNCSSNAARGAVAHELGHAFSLSHPFGCDVGGQAYCSDTVMWSWWNWPNVGFIETSFAPEKSTLLGSAWMWNKP